MRRVGRLSLLRSIDAGPLKPAWLCVHVESLVRIECRRGFSSIGLVNCLHTQPFNPKSQKIQWHRIACRLPKESSSI